MKYYKYLFQSRCNQSQREKVCKTKAKHRDLQALEVSRFQKAKVLRTRTCAPCSRQPLVGERGKAQE